MPTIQTLKNEGTFENVVFLYNQLHEAKGELYTVLMAFLGFQKPWEVSEETRFKVFSGCMAHIESVIETVKFVRDEGYSSSVDQSDFEDLVMELLYIRVGLNPLQDSEYDDQDLICLGFHQALWEAIDQLTELQEKYDYTKSSNRIIEGIN